MVAQRRFGPLIGCVAAGLVVLGARLFQVQIVEHEVWAQQAAGLVRSARFLPSHRGKILDRHGTVLVRDEDTYRVDFRYREFRRGHPLGALAHAFSSLEMRCASIRSAYEQRAAWTDALLGLSLSDLDRFERGEALERGLIRVPKSTDPGAELRARRAADVRYYVGVLLALSPDDARWMKRLEGDARAASFLALAAGRRGVAPEKLRQRVLGDVETACAEFARIAPILFPDPTGASGGGALERGLAFLDDARATVEDEIADDLFEIAAGFEAGAVSREALAGVFDLDWIGRSLRWDRARIARWAESREPLFHARLENALLPRVLVHVELESSARRSERLLDELAFLFAPASRRDRDGDGRPRRWREIDDLVVLDEIDSLFADAGLTRGGALPDVVLPLQDPDLRGIVPEAQAPWKIVGLVSDVAGRSDGGEDQPLREPTASEAWADWGQNRAGLESQAAREELVRLVRALDRRHRGATDRALAALHASVAGGDGPNVHLAFTDSRRKRAEARERFVQVDRGNRPFRVADEPEYALVERIARHPMLFRGFDVREATRRVPVARGIDGEACAGIVLGSVGKPPLRELLKQTSDEKRLAELRFQVLRSATEEAEMKELAARVQRADEWAGASGLEDYLDPELRGRPGWLVAEGLEERARNDGEASLQAPHDGLDVVLTLDSALQNAAQHVVSHPRQPGEATDRAWFDHPVGAIVLLTPEGDVLAMASAPDENGLPLVPGRDLERGVRRERTLQRPTFNPPGSVFKPFVAAFAIDEMGFDPATTFECRDLGKGRGGFESMHCTGIHGVSDLRRALTVSCNAYFAQLGLLYGTDRAVAMVETFGFTEPTGIKSLGSAGRSGLREEIGSSARFARELQSRENHMRFANGLGVIDVVPMQVARATAGLVTGRLPDVRLVRSIGAKEIPQGSRALAIDGRALELVRGAMRDVVEGGEGSAHGKGLDAGTLGFTFACKTGSGDYRPIRDIPELGPDDRRALEAGKVRKHTWVAGWFPIDAPKAILVVYLHDVTETSSHTAVYVAAQFLQSEAVKSFVVGAEGAR